MEYSNSCQCKYWQFSEESLAACRLKVCRHAVRLAAAKNGPETDAAKQNPAPVDLLDPSPSNATAHPQAIDLACGFHSAYKISEGENEDGSSAPPLLLTPAEELLLIRFYSGKIAELVGPGSPHPRLRPAAADGSTANEPGRILFREIPATAAVLFRRFYLSNSVTVFDPKSIVAAACWLATKTEDNVATVWSIVERMGQVGVQLTEKDVVPAELDVLAGCKFHLWAVHPYKMVRGIVDDVRTYNRAEAGRKVESAVLGKTPGMATATAMLEEDISPSSRRRRNKTGSFKDADTDGKNGGEDATISAGGENGGGATRSGFGSGSAKDQGGGGFVPRLFETDHLRALHDRAVSFVDDAVVSDLVLLHPPGRIALGCLMAADVDIRSTEEGKGRFPPVNFLEYVRGRFRSTGAGGVDGGAAGHTIPRDGKLIVEEIRGLAKKVQELREGKHGCGNHGIEVTDLRAVHKKLKKVKLWGNEKDKDNKKEKKKVKKKKNKRERHSVE